MGVVSMLKVVENEFEARMRIDRKKRSDFRAFIGKNWQGDRINVL